VTAIDVSRLVVRFDDAPVLHGVSLRVDSGGWLGLIGPNGAGKSTLLRAAAGLVAHQGEVRLDGRSTASMRRRELARMVSFVPQRPITPDAMTVAEYVLLGRTPHIPYLAVEGRRDLEVAATVMERLDLAGLDARSLGSLSGGELQRAILSRALAQEPLVLLLDEPTSGLDVGHQQQVLELVDELRLERALTVVTAMHDLTLAGQFADRLVLLAGGRIAADGSPRDVLTEDGIRRHYGASVTTRSDGNGRVVVIPTRSPVRSDEA
jgi:iron complex transport system ATP-binding protein